METRFHPIAHRMRYLHCRHLTQFYHAAVTRVSSLPRHRGFCRPLSPPLDYKLTQDPPRIPLLLSFLPSSYKHLCTSNLQSNNQRRTSKHPIKISTTSHSTMAYTELFMTALIPELSVLPTIGSASENASRNEETSAYLEYICHTPEAESIRSVFGDVAYSQYMEHQCREREKRVMNDLLYFEETTQIYISLRSKSKFRRWVGWLKAAYSRDYYS